MSRADLGSLAAYLENLKAKFIQPLERELERIESIAKGAQGAQSFDNYSSMIDALNSLSKDSMKVGANILIVTLNVPDLWVSEIKEESVPYLYSDDESFVQDLTEDGKIQVGHFVLSPLETLKVNLKEYVKFTDIMTTEKVGAAGLYEGAYGGISITNGKLCLAGTAYSGRLSDAFFKNPHLYGVPLLSLDLYRWLKVGLVQNTETWETADKTKACETIGALYNEPISDNSYYCVTISKNGQSKMYYADAPQAYSIARRTTGGRLRVGEPTDDDNATTKKYVDDNKGTKLYLHDITFTETSIGPEEKSNKIRIVSTKVEPYTSLSMDNLTDGSIISIQIHMFTGTSQAWSTYRDIKSSVINIHGMDASSATTASILFSQVNRGFSDTVTAL